MTYRNPFVYSKVGRTFTSSEISDHELLGQCVLCLNYLKSIMNAHAADAAIHKIADVVNYPVTTPDCYDLSTALTLYSALESAYTNHNWEADPPATFVGAGLNDYDWRTSPAYTGLGGNYVVEIDCTGMTDTFKWSNDGGGTWEATNVNIVGWPYNSLENNLIAYFGMTSGHTMGDRWSWNMQAPASLIWHNNYRGNYRSFLYSTVDPINLNELVERITYNMWPNKGLWYGYGDSMYGHDASNYMHTIAYRHMPDYTSYYVNDSGPSIAIATPGTKIGDYVKWNIEYNGGIAWWNAYIALAYNDKTILRFSGTPNTSVISSIMIARP